MRGVRLGNARAKTSRSIDIGALKSSRNVDNGAMKTTGSDDVGTMKTGGSVDTDAIHQLFEQPNQVNS